MEAPQWLLRAWEPASPYAQKLAVWRGYEGELQTLLIYGIGIAAFTMLVFGFFCKYLSRRDFVRPQGTGRFMQTMHALVVFPAVSFLFFGVLASSLFLLAKSQSTPQILLLSMSVVVGVRMTAFVSEEAASDLAKLLPLSLLGVLIVDPSYASLDRTWSHFGNLFGLLPLLARYFLAFIVLESAVRVSRSAWRRVTRHRSAKRLTKEDLMDGAGSRPVPVREQARPLERKR